MSWDSTELCTSRKIGGHPRNVMVIEPLVYIVDRGKYAGLIIIVRPGYETDLASVPRLVWSVVPPDGKHSPAAVIHDILYSSEALPRDGCDEVFRLALEDTHGVSKAKAWTMWSAVRAGGWTSEFKHTSESIRLSDNYLTMNPDYHDLKGWA